MLDRKDGIYRAARGLEQREFEERGGLRGTANKQNPVGDTNKRHDEYLRAADAQKGYCPIGSGSKKYKKK
ncbi:hypothetical protein [Chitinilyticum piscinae]|uniref:hypothetical protein n=1 Tax=Chitinilyticum piscinae TaxID=2866724 RepID=UPI001D16675F|nr:hypothetical protein [Chitinilyticum piscinae]